MKLTDLQVQEATVIPVDVTVDTIMKMFDGAKRGVGLLNKLKNPAERKRHASNIFKNMNKIRGMLMRLTEPVYESTFDQIEDCFPEGAEITEDGKIIVSAQWLHDYARMLETTYDR